MSWRATERDGLALIEYDLFRPFNVRHGFVVKRARNDIDADAVYAVLGRGKRLAVTEQTHSDRVAVVDKSFDAFFPRRVKVDGLMTDLPGAVITVHAADCVPVLIASPRAVALVHAGWRGTAQGITAAAVATFAARYSIDPAGVRAVVGPCVEAVCYPVGAEVAQRFPDHVKEQHEDGAWRLDLKTANRDQLIAAGLRPEHIHVSSHCTRCDGALFHSYRREGKLRGTMIAFMEVCDAHN